MTTKVAIVRTPKDILPEIDIPVIAVVWSYSGLPPEEMEKRIVSGFERSHEGQRGWVEMVDEYLLERTGGY